MARDEPASSWRLEAVPKDKGAQLTEAALQGFRDAADRLQRPGAFDGCAIVVDGRTFAELTGFRPQGGQVIDAGVIKRAADAATMSRAKALANCRGSTSADYVSLGAFLSVCSQYGLALKAERHVSRPRTG